MWRLVAEDSHQDTETKGVATPRELLSESRESQIHM
jgi:hypothetical protein